MVEAVKEKGVSERSVGVEQFGRFMIEVFDYWRENDIGRVFVSHFDYALGMTLGLPLSSCVHSAQSGDNVVVEYNGEIYSCGHFVYPEFKLDNLSQRGYADLIETPIQQQFSTRKPIGAHLHCQGCLQRSLYSGA